MLKFRFASVLASFCLVATAVAQEPPQKPGKGPDPKKIAERCEKAAQSVQKAGDRCADGKFKNPEAQKRCFKNIERGNPFFFNGPACEPQRAKVEEYMRSKMGDKFDAMIKDGGPQGGPQGAPNGQPPGPNGQPGGNGMMPPPNGQPAMDCGKIVKGLEPRVKDCVKRESNVERKGCTEAIGSEAGKFENGPCKEPVDTLHRRACDEEKKLWEGKTDKSGQPQVLHMCETGKH
jgi:hypothetical protein